MSKEPVRSGMIEGLDGRWQTGKAITNRERIGAAPGRLKHAHWGLAPAIPYAAHTMNVAASVENPATQ
ncbi:hypothetical protein [Poseidonocella sedimentorum]|uniref:hypothetical protein n=1 Tax=Poseidonocella sedimentorum TaxID=871652 RepID=UPI0015A5E62B|nr:hypothetical protein [Poseidonocella sedimentorum]